ncbi:MAG: hypothetical protein ACK5LJ_12165, partial [Paracoccus sp. (in: a-proteobacteria)]
MTIRILLGAHKTATTELQGSLRSVRRRLSSRKLGYLGPGRLRADGLAFSTLISKGETQRQAHVALRQMIS